MEYGDQWTDQATYNQRTWLRSYLYLYAFLEDLFSITGDSRQSALKPTHEQVVKSKFVSFANHDFDRRIKDEVRSANAVALAIENMGYAMASIAGMPGKEILVIGNPIAAGHVSWHTLRYAGWRQKFEIENPSKKKEVYYERWVEKIKDIEPVITGINQRYERAIKTSWIPGFEVDDEELEIIRTKYESREWFTRYSPAA